jgi:hypothetical protein
MYDKIKNFIRQSQILFMKIEMNILSTLYIQYQSLKLLNMKLDENILKTCQGLVMNCNCKVLILDVLGEHRVFLVNDVHLKTRECRYNEVRDAQDITTLVLNIGHNFVNGMTEQALLERTQSIHKEDFKFGTDNYLLITKVDLNR